jgi:outer membrane protein OmpA-like peptidoglycan-associated protein
MKFGGNVMRLIKYCFLGAIATLLAGTFQGGAPVALGQQPVMIRKPLTDMRSAIAISYPEDTSLEVEFAGTRRLPRASGEAKVERKRGVTKIEIELDEMKPATLFGGDFATYVFWTVSPEGHTYNAGEFILRGDRSKLDVTTPLQTFGMFVTAEPHFLVETPSRFIILENSRPKENITGQMIKTSTIEYRGYDGIYDFSQESLAREPEAKGEVRSDVRQAMVAIELAERAGAEQFAAEELAKARQSWQKTINAAEAGLDDRQLAPLGHETVRLAVEAEMLAKERALQFGLDAERKTRASEIAKLRSEIKEAMGMVADTRETARGLIVNLPDILFDFDQATLKPQAEVALSKLCGIMLVADGYKLSIEGHTDSVGSEEYNQRLSERRADSVRKYLTSCGVSSYMLSSKGYGESQPIASNDNTEGRQTNRRVEIVIRTIDNVAESVR